jgi:hypothetical protein
MSHALCVFGGTLGVAAISGVLGASRAGVMSDIVSPQLWAVGKSGRSQRPAAGTGQ